MARYDAYLAGEQARFNRGGARLGGSDETVGAALRGKIAPERGRGPIVQAPAAGPRHARCLTFQAGADIVC